MPSYLLSVNGTDNPDAAMLRLQAALIERVEHEPDQRKKLKPRKKMKGESETRIINIAQLLDYSPAPHNSLDAHDLTDPPVVWAAEADLLKAGHLPETIEAMITADLAVRWEVPDAEAYIVLTSYGAWRARTVIKERWIPVEIETKEGTKTLAVEVPCWLERTLDKTGHPMAVDGPVRQPQHANEARLPFPEEVIDKRPGPAQEAEAAEEYLMQEMTRPDGRIDYDPATGKPKKTEVLLLARYAPEGGKIPKAKAKKSKPSRPTPSPQSPAILIGGLGASPLPPDAAEKKWAGASAGAEKTKGRQRKRGRRRP